MLLRPRRCRVKEQAKDILVPPLLRNCLTVNYIFPSYYLPSGTVVLAIVFTLQDTLKMSMMIPSKNAEAHVIS